MSSRPTISVAIATYNGAKYLRAQIDSILAQSYQDFEIVVSDDGSTDGTSEILREYAARGRVRHLPTGTRLGFARNFERAIIACHGRYIALCDQDDVWKPDRMDGLRAGLGDASLTYGLAEEYYDLDGICRPVPVPPHYLPLLRSFGSGSPVCQLMAENWIVSHTCFFDAALVAQAFPMPPQQQSHDHWIGLVAAAVGRIKYAGTQRMIYRQHRESVTWHSAGHAFPRWWSYDALVIWQKKNERERARLSAVAAMPGLFGKHVHFARTLAAFYAEERAFVRLARARVIAPYFLAKQSKLSQVRFALREALYATMQRYVWRSAGRSPVVAQH